jgi:SAM-dependent methyltransferase
MIVFRGQPMKFHLEVPDHLHRNSKHVGDAGYEETGQCLINLATQRVGLKTLADTDVLDIGCGVRFTQTIINRDIPIKSYTGIEIHRPIVEFMNKQVEPVDSRFRFVYWHVQNDYYNNAAPMSLRDFSQIPVPGRFDLIWLFSVFTHLDESGARAMLTLTRKAVRDDGRLLFTAFVDSELDGVESRGPDHRLHMVFYGRRTVERMLKDTGWNLQSFYPGGPEPFIQPCFVCSTGN